MGVPVQQHLDSSMNLTAVPTLLKVKKSVSDICLECIYLLEPNVILCGLHSDAATLPEIHQVKYLVHNKCIMRVGSMDIPISLPVD